MKLYYNCNRPVEVLTSGKILASKTAHGVSLSESFDLGSHGPFKIEFTDPAFALHLTRCIYMFPLLERKDPNRLRSKIIGYKDQFGNTYTAEQRGALLDKHGSRIIKTEMFADECEWWGEVDLTFTTSEVTAIYFMKNTPVIQPIVTKRARASLSQMFPSIYREITVNDPRMRPLTELQS